MCRDKVHYVKQELRHRLGHVTLAQLQSFVLVARHGSVKAAAAELGVSEPAVSVAVAALRKELGDELFVRHRRGIALTPGGQRLAALASEILGLAEQARRSVHDAPGRIQLVATPLVAEHVGPLIEAFGARDDGLEVEIAAVPGQAFARMLEHRRADIALGPHPGHETAGTIATVPFLRCRVIVVASPRHPLAGAGAIEPAALRDERWLMGPPDLDADTTTSACFERWGIAPDDLAGYTSHSAAIAAAAGGEGILLTLSHAVLDEIRRRALVRLEVRGTPFDEMWHASTLGLGRALPAALALQRFATTSDATQAMATGRTGTATTRARSRVHVSLWRSVADQ
jgi:DNA-binding transcriptional LysR family regulator